MSEFKVLYKGTTTEIIEKKSRFIAIIKEIKSEEEGLLFVEKIKKENPSASHNCYAISLGQNNEFLRFSDDGEPQGTAGKPMLDLIIARGIHNIAAVVTRYFGGTLLGTGGLVRAYQRALNEGIDNSIVLELNKGYKIEVKTDYNGIGKIQFIAGSMSVVIQDTIYTEDVKGIFILRQEELDKFSEKVMDKTFGKAEINILEEIEFGMDNGNCIIY
jgi:uncharacterized YigZ family protein